MRAGRIFSTGLHETVQSCLVVPGKSVRKERWDALERPPRQQQY